jgi:DNA-binding CsgD family transcriptional regulator
MLAETMVGGRPRGTLLGRRSEREALDRLLHAVRGGASPVLVLRGEPGMGKTALLEYVVEQASGCRVARAAGVQSEMELAFAGVHQLCAPMLESLVRLPGPQRDALGTAFGLRAGEAPERFVLGLAVLGLLAVVAEERPLVCLVDDAHWLDRASAQALAFVARRLLAESVALVFTVRAPGEHEFAGLPELVVDGLGNGDALSLLDSVVSGPLDERVRERIVAETRGNPLALMELPGALTPAELAGGFALPDAMALPGRIEDVYRWRLAQLPAQTRLLLLVAAADPVGDSVSMWRAAERLGIGPGAAAAATAAGLAEFGPRVRFRHPLVRSAVYRAASLGERRSVHAALAEATEPEADPDRRAWHRAHAAAEPDEDVADELERSAGRVRARGGLAAAAAFLDRAAGLTPDSATRARRALAAAQATLQAGAPDAALALLGTAQAGPLDDLQRARADVLRAQIAFAVNRGRHAPRLLLAAAKQLEPLDVRLARETYLDAFSAALFAGRLASGGGVRQAAQAARAAPAAPQPPRAPDLLLDGLAVLITEGYPSGTPILKRALTAFRGPDVSGEEGIRWLWLACHAAIVLWDDESWHVLATRHLQLARDAGALTVLPIALSSRMGVHMFAGELRAAASHLGELEAVTEATGSDVEVYGALPLAVWQGRERDAATLIEAATKEALARGEGMGVAIAQWATALLYNSLGRHEDALVAAEQAGEHPDELWSTGVLPELILAAARSGRADRAADALQRLSQTTRASGTEWALGVEARSRALLSEGETAETLYREAIERLRRTRVRADLARCHLLYGEWLRRERRRLDAREQLRTAYETFTVMGAEVFAGRAAAELVATGETARRRTVESSDQLTPREAQIARLARDGLSNSDIGSQLFISPRTVEYHLTRVFTKLGVSSRNQLHDVLSSGPHAQPA